MGWIRKFLLSGCFISSFVLVATSTNAQLSLDVQLNETLAHSQSINIQSLAAGNGSGPLLFRMFLRNENSSEYLRDLYFRIVVESQNVGRIAEIKQAMGHPLSLSPGQQIIATNNNMGDGLPGIEGAVQFSGELTQGGKEFINGLQGSTALPADNYRIIIELYQGGVGAELLASTTAEFGTNLIEGSQDLYLLSPGDVLGSANTAIPNSFPNFQWQGAAGTNYRLLVVEAKDTESPQSLLSGAASTAPTRNLEAVTGDGSLVKYEMLDVLVNQPNFQYPSSGVQDLEAGSTYYWQVISLLETSTGKEKQESEIWSFRLLDPQSSSVVQQNSEFAKILRELLGDRLQELRNNGYLFEGVTIDSRSFQGGHGLQKLLDLKQRIQQGEVSIIIEDQQ